MGISEGLLAMSLGVGIGVIIVLIINYFSDKYVSDGGKSSNTPLQTVITISYRVVSTNKQGYSNVETNDCVVRALMASFDMTYM